MFNNESKSPHQHTKMEKLIISIDAEKAFDRTQHPFMGGNKGQQNQKTFNRLGIEVNILNLKKGIYEKPTSNIR